MHLILAGDTGGCVVLKLQEKDEVKILLSKSETAEETEGKLMQKLNAKY